MEGVMGSCNNGNIIGRSIQATNINTFVSQLTILVYNPLFNAGNITCSLDTDGIVTHIGTAAELMTSGIFINT
jgi:hypothetical protein